MVFLRHNNFEFKNILSENYNIQEDIYDVLATETLADGSVRRNYGILPKTTIKIKFGRLNASDMTTYMSHFENNEGTYTYFSPKSNSTKTAIFYVEKPENSIVYADDSSKEYGEFEVTLKQIGVVS